MLWKHSTMTHKHPHNKTQPHHLHLLLLQTNAHKRYQCPPSEFKFQHALFPPPLTTFVTVQATPFQPAPSATVSALNPLEYQCLLFLLLSPWKLLLKLLLPHLPRLETVKILTLFMVLVIFSVEVIFLYCLIEIEMKLAFETLMVLVERVL